MTTQFVKVATVHDLESGKGMVVILNGTRVAIFNCAGTYYAIKGTCPHMGGELWEGLLEGEIVTCPWHGWQFNVRTGKNPESEVVGVRTFEVKVEGEDILLGV